MTMQEALQKPARILEAVQSLLEPSAERRASLERLRADVRSFDPPSAAADAIERWAIEDSAWRS
jgi:hypothetical protein